ncbi:MAG: T9SS type A sorting domain-containing protein [Candidatus Kapabacteria bacterium]|nr:T9SS type A sorting domain-containing protein [Candidatus Kapabacteria bacterium]
MKNFYLMVVLAILLPLSIIAKPVDKSVLGPAQPNQHIDISKIGIKPSDVIKVKTGDYPASQMAFKVIDMNLEYFWSAMFDAVTPFTYEPKSNTLIYVTTDRQTVDGWADGSVYLHFSNDGGQNWTKAPIYTEKKVMLFFPSISVLNPNNESDPSKFKYVITVTPFIPRPTPNDTTYYAEGNQYLFFNGQGWDKVEKFPEKAPVQNNVGGVQQWGVTNKQSFAISSSKGDHFYVYGTLTPLDGYQYGAYGLSYIDFTGSTLNPQSKVPAEWGTAQFKDAGSLGSSWNAPIRMGGDNEGNIYSFIFNIFKDDEDHRIPAFSKSVDNGKTWSQFARMPFSIISDFLALWQHNPDFNYYAYAYTNMATVVTGVDEFSIFMRLFSIVGTTQENAVATGHYVEAQYKNGTWQPLRRIGELNISPLRIANSSGTTALKDSLYLSPRYNEIQAAKTADGQSIILKWLDTPNEGNIAKLNTPVRLIGSFPAETLDSVNATDIFVAYRTLSNPNWDAPYNLTNDLWYNRGTYIPEIVPSLTQIPIVEYITQEFTATNPRYAYPYFVQNIVGDRGGRDFPVAYSLVAAVHDAKNPVPVRNPTLQTPKGLVTSVLETLPFSLNAISPNPANEFAAINFIMDYDATVSVNIHNTMGQIVKSVFNGQAQAGQNTINVITSDLTAGAYYYSINVNGKSQTKLLNVIR